MAGTLNVSCRRLMDGSSSDDAPAACMTVTVAVFPSAPVNRMVPVLSDPVLDVLIMATFVPSPVPSMLSMSSQSSPLVTSAVHDWFASIVSVPSAFVNCVLSAGALIVVGVTRR